MESKLGFLGREKQEKVPVEGERRGAAGGEGGAAGGGGETSSSCWLEGAGRGWVLEKVSCIDFLFICGPVYIQHIYKMLEIHIALVCSRRTNKNSNPAENFRLSCTNPCLFGFVRWV